MNAHRPVQRCQSQEESDSLMALEKSEWQEPTVSLLILFHFVSQDHTPYDPGRFNIIIFKQYSC